MAGILVLSAFDENGESNWPARWPTELLRERQRLDPIAFASQYLMTPVNMAENPLKLEYFTFVLDIPQYLDYYIGVDPSPTGKAGSDYFALTVVGKDPVSNICYIVESHRLHIEPLEQVEFIRDRYFTYHVKLAVIEAYSAQKLFTRYFFNEGPHMNIREAKGTNVPKGMRYASMVKFFTSFNVLVKGELDQHGIIGPAKSVAPFVNEWVAWNDLSDRDDVLDSAGKALEAAGLSTDVIRGVSASSTPQLPQDKERGIASLHIAHGQGLSIRRRPATIGEVRRQHRRNIG